MQHEQERAIIRRNQQLRAELYQTVPECLARYDAANQRCQVRELNVGFALEYDILSNADDLERAQIYFRLQLQILRHTEDRAVYLNDNSTLDLISQHRWWASQILPCTKFFTHHELGCSQEAFWAHRKESYEQRHAAWLEICRDADVLKLIPDFEKKSGPLNCDIHNAIYQFSLLNRKMILERYTPLCGDIVRMIVDEWL